MTFPEPLLRVWNINRRNALPAWPHRRRSRRRHGRHTAPKKEERKRESERKSHKSQADLFCLYACVCFVVSPMNNRRVHDLCAVWVNFVSEFWEQSFDAPPTSPASIICLSVAPSLSFTLSLCLSPSSYCTNFWNKPNCYDHKMFPEKTCKHFVRSASCVQSIDERKYYYFFHSENSQLLHRENIDYACMWMYLLYIYSDFGLVCTQCLCFWGESFVQFVAEVTSNFSVISK